jgi:hypothetical protein
MRFLLHLRECLNHELVEHPLSRFQWYRKLRGGRWELHYIDWPVCSDLWLPMKDERRWPISRPSLSRGIPLVEDW